MGLLPYFRLIGADPVRFGFSLEMGHGRAQASNTEDSAPQAVYWR